MHTTKPLPAPLAEILSNRGHVAPPPNASNSYTLRQIPEHLGCHYSTVSRQLRREEHQLAQRKT